MATYYVGLGGNDGNNGLTWALRKLTLNGAEDIPVAANDTVYVAPGAYREMLTCDVSGAAGQPIAYIGDVTGEHTDGIGGPVRITGSDNDQTAARAYCITCGAQRDYRTFRGFTMDTTSTALIYGGVTAGTHWIIEDFTLQAASGIEHIRILGANQSTWIIRRGRLIGNSCIVLFHDVTVDDTGHLIEDCVFGPGGGLAPDAINIYRIGGITIRNCTIMGYGGGNLVIVNIVPDVGQTITVNNCILGYARYGLYSAALGYLVEDYNTFYGNTTDRTNVGVGASSVTYPPLFDLGLLHAGAGQVSGFRFPQPRSGALSQWSAVRAIADTGAATLDISGVPRPATDTKRSWGAVQYEPVGRETATIHGGALAMRLDDAGRRQFWIPYPGDQTAITVSVWVYYEADYAGNPPSMIIKQPGQADRQTAAAGGAGAWELLTDTFTPNHKPDWICVELVSENTDTANAATNDVFFDDLTVTLGTLGDMETWLWDQEVSDWVAAEGGACDYPAEEDVEWGVVYGDGAYTGTMICRHPCPRFPNREVRFPNC